MRERIMAKEKKGTNRQEDTRVKDRITRPRKYKVIMMNDDYTPMEFVVGILEQIFHRSSAEATRIMMTVHKEGSGIAGVYSREIAETKKNQCIQIARSNGFPLM